MESSDVARCAIVKEKTKTFKVLLYWPSVPLCVHLNCTELHYLQVAEGMLPLVQEFPTSLQIPAELPHRQKSGNLSLGMRKGDVSLHTAVLLHKRYRGCDVYIVH